MVAIRNYNDTRIELNIAMNKLDQLNEKKNMLYAKYCSLTTENFEDVGRPINKKRDKMIEYLIELEKVNPITGKSLEQEINEQRNIVNKLQYYINLMEYNLQQLEGIEYKLYYAIVCEKENTNKSVTQIIEEFAENNYMHEQTIWQNYYPKIKPELEKLKMYSENIVKTTV